jgi:alpha-N-arabinofuranosidase
MSLKQIGDSPDCSSQPSRHRRAFLKAIACSGLTALVVSRPLSAADAEIQLLLQETGPTINPHIYGHFIEHLGGVIYDGIWVGRKSKIPNIDGIRQQFVEDMRRIAAPNLRWPGGCFADAYHWRDGIGPSAKRPRTYNFWESRMPAGLHATESNEFGIHEFMRLCRLVGAQPYVAGNVGSGTPREFHDWVSYCNAPAGTVSLADERASNGDREPFGVRYWGVGNESWGCGGNMKPGEYATLFRQFATQFPVYVQPFLIATGPRGHSRDGDVAWTTGFFEAMRGHREQAHGLGLHFYTDFRNTTVKAAESSPQEWYAVLREGLRTEAVIEQHWKAMERFDPEHRTKLVIDEWGVWYPPGFEITPGYILSQPIILRDALHTAITLDIFNRHAAKIEMTNVAQTINCIHSLFLAHEEKYVRTPAYYVFEMYRPHMGAQLVPMQLRSDQQMVSIIDGSIKIPVITGSASRREKQLMVTLVNGSLDSPVVTRLHLTNSIRATEGRGTVLTHREIHATNSFQAPNEMVPSSFPVTTAGDTVTVTVPKQSVVAVELRIV